MKIDTEAVVIPWSLSEAPVGLLDVQGTAEPAARALVRYYRGK